MFQKERESRLRDVSFSYYSFSSFEGRCGVSRSGKTILCFIRARLRFLDSDFSTGDNEGNGGAWHWTFALSYNSLGNRDETGWLTHPAISLRAPVRFLIQIFIRVSRGNGGVWGFGQPKSTPGSSSSESRLFLLAPGRINRWTPSMAFISLKLMSNPIGMLRSFM